MKRGQIYHLIQLLFTLSSHISMNLSYIKTIKYINSLTLKSHNSYFVDCLGDKKIVNTYIMGLILPNSN